MPRALFTCGMLVAVAAGACRRAPLERPAFELRLVAGEPNVGLDPATASTALSIAGMELLHEPLVERGPDSRPLPALAESWSTNATSTRWTFQLREGLRFSDGSPLTAGDVEFSFRRMMAAPLWKSRLDAITGIATPGARTVVIDFARPMPEFLDLPGGQIGYFVVSRRACAAGCDFTRPGTPVSGPWALGEWTVKRRMVLDRNPHYWRAGFPKFTRVVFEFTTDMTAAVAAVESGTADVTQPVPAKDIVRLRANPGVTIFRGLRMDQFRGWGFDKTRPPFHDRRVRQAVGYLMEPQDATDACWYGLGNTLWGGLFYDADKQWAPLLARNPWKSPRPGRVALARRLLREAGWHEASGDARVSRGVAGIADGTPLAVTAVYERSWVQSECHALLMQSWLKEGGIRLTLEPREKATYYPDVRAGKFQMWHIGSTTSLIPWEKFRGWFHSEAGDLTGRVNSPELDARIEAAYREPDVARRNRLLSDLADYLAEEQFVLATGSQDSLVLVNARIQGFYMASNMSWRALARAERRP